MVLSTNARSLATATRTQPQPQHTVEQVAPQVVETVSVTLRPTQMRSDLLTPEEQWTWSELRDYVVAQIEDLHGPFPRDARKEASIFQRFCKEYGSAAPAIARYAFEVKDGRWKGAPISVSRFCKASDPWFAQPILEYLTTD